LSDLITAIFQGHSKKISFIEKKYRENVRKRVLRLGRISSSQKSSWSSLIEAPVISGQLVQVRMKSLL